MSETQKQNSPYLIPGSILIAGILIAFGIFSSGSAGGERSPDTGSRQVVPTAEASADNIKPVTSEDHILGNPNAPVKIVEFSDLECPFCQRLHPTLKRVVEEYDGEVAWVYRHFPIAKLHSKAPIEAIATECANELGGNDGFWEYVDRLFEISPTNNGLDLSLLPQIAEDVGLDRAKFETCLLDNNYVAHVQADLQDAVDSGGEGTPYSVIIAPNGKTFAFSGAVPFETFKATIDLALKEK